MSGLNQFSNNVMIGLAGAVVALLALLLWFSLRRPILAKLGVRNIPRRPVQSVLIVVGLTLSTIIIVSALSTGDTLNYSVRRHAVNAYGEIDEIIAPPLLSLFATMADEDSPDAAAAGETSETEQQMQQLMEGGLTSVLAVLQGGLPGISVERYRQLRAEAAQEPDIDAVAASIIFPTIVRDVSTGQGEPLGFIFAVDADYDEKFGLTTVEGERVEMANLRPGVGNIFVQAANLFTMVQSLVQDAGAALGLEEFSISDVAVATAAVGAALTSGSDQGIDLAQISIDVNTLKALGIDTTALEEEGVTSVNLASLGLDANTLQAVGVNTTTVQLDEVGQAVGLDTSGLSALGSDLLGQVNLNTLGSEIDRVLGQFGLQLRQGDVYLNRLGAEQLNARVGDILEIYIGPIPIPFRVKAIVEQAGPMGALAPVVMMRLDEAQQLLFMPNKVNNVLISNRGDAFTGIQQTAAVSERLRVLALDPDTLANVVAILRRPAVRAVIADRAARIQETMREEIDAPPIIANFVQNLGEMQQYQERIRSLPAELEKPGISDGLHSLLADREMRTWLTQQPLPAQDAAELNRALRELNQFDLIDPLNKEVVVQAADVGGAVFSSVFMLFGVFSILAGVMLIFLIYVMLATERRSEMGMARAIGVQRSHLVQMFVTEGVLYDLIAALLGVGLGLAISYAMVGFLGNLFNTVSSQLRAPGNLFSFQFHVAPSSVIVSYCLGVLLTFVIVTLASWRVSRLNIVAAIRDLPEEADPDRHTPIRRAWRWTMGLLLLLAGLYFVFLLPAWGQTGTLIGASLILGGASILGERLLERTRMRADQAKRLLYTVVGLGFLAIWALPWSALFGTAGTVMDQDNAYFLAAFVLTAPMIILGAIMVVMFNADAITWFFSRLLSGIGALTPVLKTAIAYPLSARFRTGMAMVMFAMIITTVVVMAVVIQATQAIIVMDEKESAGFEISTSGTLLSFFDPITDLEAEIAQQTEFPQDDIMAVGGVATQDLEIRQVTPSLQASTSVTPTAAAWLPTQIKGLDEGYLQQAERVYTFQQRAPGYESDDAIWAALRTRDDVAIITPNFIAEAAADDAAGETGDGEIIVAGGDEGEQPNFLPAFRLTGVDLGGRQLPEIQLELRATGAGGGAGGEAIPHKVQVIGLLADNTTLAGGEIQMNVAGLARIQGKSVIPSNFYVKVREGADVAVVAQALERAFLSSGLNATVMAESFAAGKDVTRGILQLFQGFMALGLLVGIAALGVISSRTVVERRQQVGMLRAIGYQARMVAFSFLLESSFIAVTGIAIGAAAGLIVGQNMVTMFFTDLTPGSQFALPWLSIGGILLLAYGFSLLTTIVPAYQSARIYPAEALRYE